MEFLRHHVFLTESRPLRTSENNTDPITEWENVFSGPLNSVLVYSFISKLTWNVVKCSPVGTTWIYPVYPPNYTPGAPRYCQRTTYQFAFIVTTLVWVSLTLVFLCGFCFSLLTCCKTVTARRRLIPNRNSFYGAISEEPTAGDVWFWQEWNFWHRVWLILFLLLRVILLLLALLLLALLLSLLFTLRLQGQKRAENRLMGFDDE